MATFLQARHFYVGRRRPIRLIVVHDMEYTERLDAAEQVARMFSTTTRSASAHTCIDADSEVRCVRDADTAFAAPGANADGLQIEHAGYARQSRLEWLDPYGVQMLNRSARRAAEWCQKYALPPRRLGVSEIAGLSAKGICGHWDVSKAFGLSSHWDPGGQFPWDWWMDQVLTYLKGAVIVPTIDLTHPAFLVRLGSPEESFLRAYLRGAARTNDKGDLYRNYQIVAFDPALPLPAVPRDSVAVAAHVEGWGDIAPPQGDRIDTLRELVKFLGLPVCPST